jgi:hypothetical protein
MSAQPLSAQHNGPLVRETVEFAGDIKGKASTHRRCPRTRLKASASILALAGAFAVFGILPAGASASSGCGTYRVDASNGTGGWIAMTRYFCWNNGAITYVRRRTAWPYQKLSIYANNWQGWSHDPAGVHGSEKFTIGNSLVWSAYGKNNKYIEGNFQVCSQYVTVCFGNSYAWAYMILYGDGTAQCYHDYNYKGWVNCRRA